MDMITFAKHGRMTAQKYHSTCNVQTLCTGWKRSISSVYNYYGRAIGNALKDHYAANSPVSVIFCTLLEN